MKNIKDALLSLYSKNEWVLRERTYAGLVWLDQNQTKPTQKELEAEVERLQREYENTEYQRLRAAEYPDFKEYLDGVVKNDQDQIDKYIQDCLAVKEKYPKPSGVA